MTTTSRNPLGVVGINGLLKLTSYIQHKTMFRDISNIDKVDEKTDAKRSIFTTLEYLIWS